MGGAVGFGVGLDACVASFGDELLWWVVCGWVDGLRFVLIRF